MREQPKRVFNGSLFFSEAVMRYHYTKSKANAPVYGKIFRCNHPVYDRCTLYLIGSKGLGVIQQRFDPRTKQTSWTEIDDELVDQLYLAKGFDIFFDRFAGIRRNGYYPTVTVGAETETAGKVLLGDRFRPEADLIRAKITFYYGSNQQTMN